MPPAKVPLLVRTMGAEVGVRTSILPGLVSTLSFWYLHSDSELTFAGDSRRHRGERPRARSYGVEWANFYKPTSLADAQRGRLAHPRALPRQLRGARLHRQLDPGVVISAAATVEAPIGALRQRPASPLQRAAAHRGRQRRGSRPRRSSTPRSATATDVRGVVEVLNLFDSRSDDIAYYYASRLKGEPAGGVYDVHLHPAEPFEIRAGLTMHY